MQDELDWLVSVKESTIGFLEKLRSETQPGFYHYSATGDLFGEEKGWGLGNTVFAVKILYTLGQLEVISENHRKVLADFMLSFQKEDGSISDPLVHRKSRLSNMENAIRNFSFSNIAGEQTIRAETRQAMSSLRLLDVRPERMYGKIPYGVEGVEKYLRSLNWRDPWSAGSHFSHLLFFHKYNGRVFGHRREESERMIDVAVDYVNGMQSKDDGVWYAGTSVPVQLKINGAMKILTGLKAAGRMDFKYPDKIIDLVLPAKNNDHSCDNFNIVYVLKYANEMTGGTYRNPEIQDFCRRRISIYRKYYHPDAGGFSFFPGQSNIGYYGARITKGFNEPDIHGTCLFLWGISLISQLLNLSEHLGYKEFIA